MSSPIIKRIVTRFLKEPLRKVAKSIFKANGSIIGVCRKRPSALILLFPAYCVLSAVLPFLALAFTLAFLSMNLLSEDVAEPIFYLICVILLGAAWIHYLVLIMTAFAQNIRIEGDLPSVLKITETLVLVIFVFAVGFYYLQLFSDNRAFKGMHPIKIEGLERERNPGIAMEDRLTSVPDDEVIVDCLYFSVVTITTLGYGDISPQTKLAKLLTALEVVAGFVLIVLALGSVIGTKSHAPATRNDDEA